MSKSGLLLALESAIDWSALDGGSIVVACSGGPDSTALACAAARIIGSPACASYWPTAKPRLVLWHLDHQLRDASAQDAEFVRRLGAKLGAQVIVERIDIGRLALELKSNVEAVAREQRYTLLHALCDPAAHDPRFAQPALACTAHHLQDQAETILMRMLRGAQARGLRGILPWHGSRIFRPWLKIPRSQILQFLAEIAQDYVHDASNQDRSRTRNLIRHEVLPLLDGISGGKAAWRIARLAQVAEQAAAEVEAQLSAMQVTRLDQEMLAQCLPLAGKPAGRYSAHIAQRPWLAGSVLGDYLVGEFARHGVMLEGCHLDNLDALATHPTRPVYLRNWSVSLSAPNRLLIASPPAANRDALQLELSEQQPAELDCVSVVFTQGAAPAATEPDSGESISELKTWGKMLGRLAQGIPGMIEWRCRLPVTVQLPLAVRTWRQGDRIKLTNGVSKKLSDVFIDAKIPAVFRSSWLVLVDAGDAVVWVPGLADSRLMAAGAAAPGWEVRIIARPHAVTAQAGAITCCRGTAVERRDARI